MKLGIFGATGNTGLATVRVALENGHSVTVLVRSPEKLPQEVREGLARIVQGDVLNKDDVLKVVEGQDAIIVALGTGTDLSPTTVLSEGLKNVLEVMKAVGIQRVSACLSGFLFFERDKLPPRFNDLTEEHRRMLDALRASDRQWVAVCPPHIADDPPTGDYKVITDRSPGRRIAKLDLGHFLITCLETDEYLRQSVGIGYDALAEPLKTSDLH